MPFKEDAYEAGFDNMTRRLLGISKIQELVGYRPTLDLSHMLVPVILYEQERLELNARR